MLGDPFEDYFSCVSFFNNLCSGEHLHTAALYHITAADPTLMEATASATATIRAIGRQGWWAPNRSLKCISFLRLKINERLRETRACSQREPGARFTQLLKEEKSHPLLWELWIPKFAELYCDGDGGSSNGYYDDSYYGNAYDDDAIVTGRTRYGYNRCEITEY